MNALSIIIPVHNEEQYLHNLLQSIERYLKPHINYQIIVVLNGCIDNSLNIAKEYPCEIVNIESKVYPSVARNKGRTAAKYFVLAFLDADVVITERWAKRINELIPTLLKFPKTLTGDRCHTPDNPTILEKWWFGSYKQNNINYINGANIITTKRLFDDIGGFDEDIETNEDITFSRKARKTGSKIERDEELYTIHHGYPRNLRDFITRERWHGYGDFQNLNVALHSKVALITLLFVILHIILVSAIFHAIFTNSWLIIITSVILIISLCLLCSVFKFKTINIVHILFCSCIYYLYFFGRSLAVHDAVRTRMKTMICRT